MRLPDLPEGLPARFYRAGRPHSFTHSPVSDRFAEIGALSGDLPFEILHETDDFWVVNKPAGFYSGYRHVESCVPYQLFARAGQALIQHWPKGEYARTHAIDLPTTGVLVVSKTRHVRDRLFKEIFSLNKNEKYYMALVHEDNPLGSSGEFSDPIYTSKRKGSFFTHLVLSEEEAASRPAVELWTRRESRTQYRVVERFERNGESLALLLLRIFTGRTHQIRFHCYLSGNPIFADFIYNEREYAEDDPLYNMRPYSALHARKLSFVNPFDQKKLSVEAPLPEDLLRLLHSLRTGEDP